MGRDDAIVELGALLHVGLDVELPRRREQPRHLREEDVAHHQALRVLLFPPGIGEVKKRSRHAADRTEAWEREPCVLAEDASTDGVPLLREAGIADRRPLAPDLEAQERGLGSRDRPLREEPRLRTWPDLELDPRAAHDLTQVDRIAFGETRRIRIGAARRRKRWSLRGAVVGGSIGHGVPGPDRRARRSGQGLLKFGQIPMATRQGEWARVKRLAPFAPLVLATAMLARAAIRAVYAKLGHPGASLDDAYIHFQYARAIAEGHPLRFQAGEPISTGATSFLWPAILALPYALGVHGESILWAAWVVSFVALAALAFETYAITLPLAGRGAAIGAGAMTLGFGGFAWSAASGMEVVPFAWMLAHAVRRASEWSEDPGRRTRRELRILVALALLAPFMRPEGVVASLVLGVAVVLHPRVPGARGRAEAVLFLAAAVAPNLLLLALTGRATSSTAQVKLLLGNPYYVMPDAAIANARILVGTILEGEVWSAEFLPKGGAPLACAGLAALIWRGQASRRTFRAAAVLVLALAMFVPCLYVTFLWNRLRYLWPFAPGWFIGLACLARALGTLIGRVDARAGATATTLLAGGFAGALAVRLDWVIEDVAQSASGIDRQQAALGRWADGNLPRTARIGVNDTGAVAYFGNRLTFDIVGLTTPSEGRYWVAGAGSRFEHYERLGRSSPGSLPTHFIVYPEWMGCDAVLGNTLHEAVVTDSSILGGQVMRVYDARWDNLGTGELPWTKTGRVLDTVDVADLQSEAEHAYALLDARDGEQSAEEGNAPDGAIVVDGGRTHRVRDRFVVKLPVGRAAHGLGRVKGAAGLTLHVLVDHREMLSQRLEPGPWTEIAFDIPAELASESTGIEVIADGATFTSFHWWVAQ